MNILDYLVKVEVWTRDRFITIKSMEELNAFPKDDIRVLVCESNKGKLWVSKDKLNYWCVTVFNNRPISFDHDSNNFLNLDCKDPTLYELLTETILAATPYGDWVNKIIPIILNNVCEKFSIDWPRIFYK